MLPHKNHSARYLIIGASGFIGSHILDYTRSSGYKAEGTQSGNKYPQLISFNLMQHRIKDCIENSFFETDDPVFGVICATIGQIDRCFREKETSYIINVKNTIRLIKDMIALGIKPVFLSSSFVYDGNTGYYDEEYPHSPISEYGRHKAEVEAFIINNIPNALVLRLDKIIGDDPLEKHLLSEWYQWVKENRVITCIEDQIFSPTFVNDVAKAIVICCRQNLSGLYNVANSEYFTRTELAKQFMLALDEETEIVSKPQDDFSFLDQRPLKSYLDSTKFVKATGMKFTSMREVFGVFIQKIQLNPS
ncbi:MAG: sugar nucleotide-binding protein [Desulfobacterales bacterium]|nr:sugar nucleotide-binding protein [Desulfobacterales bacterium]